MTEQAKKKYSFFSLQIDIILVSEKLKKKHQNHEMMAGQTINDRLLAARHSLAGQGLAKSVCKATTEEMIAPKKKHLDCKCQSHTYTYLKCYCRIYAS